MKTSHLLINEPPLLVPPTLAKIVGLDEAIVLQQVHYWLSNPKAEGRIDDEGNKWIYNTYEDWQENFPFWSTDKIKRIFLKLEKLGVIIAEQLDAQKRDMTKFYRIDYDKLCTMDGAILPPSNGAKLHDVNMNQRLPETTHGADAPKPSMPIEWQIVGGVEQIVKPDEEQARRADFANLLAMGMTNADTARAIALAFQEARGITLPTSKVKGQRKAVKEMIEMGVQPEHVRAATRQLTEKGMTVSDLFSIVKTAIDLANAPKPQERTIPTLERDL